MNWDPEFYQKNPLFLPISVVASRFNQYRNWPSIQHYNEELNEWLHSVKIDGINSLCFLQQLKIVSDAFDQRYEVMIRQTGKIPTRAHNWHDFFNALVWVSFPKTKLKLNQCQYDCQLENYQNNTHHRSHLENTLAQFDETGVVIVSANSQLTTMIYQHQWLDLFYHRQHSLLNEMQFFVFGHGLYEKALTPFIGMTGKAIILKADNHFISYSLEEKLQWIDHQLAEYISMIPANKRCKEILQPLPVLGIRGWYHEQNLAFYSNNDYFRPLATTKGSCEK